MFSKAKFTKSKPFWGYISDTVLKNAMVTKYIISRISEFYCIFRPGAISSVTSVSWGEKKREGKKMIY